MSMRFFVENFDKIVIDEKVSVDYRVTEEAKRHPEEPVYFTLFPGGKLIVNLWSTRERLGRALGVEKDEIIDVLADATDDPVEPRIIDDPPALKNRLDDFDLRELPIPKYYPGDGGRYITSGIVFSEYGGARNMSYHRSMLIGKDRFAIRIVKRDLFKMYTRAMNKGEDLPVVMAVGLCPPLLLAGSTSVEFDRDELEIASAIRQKASGDAVEAAKLDNGQLVPAHSEYLLQGRITGEMVNEAPFVDITGTYDHVRQQPVFEVDRVYHKDDPIFHALLPGGNEHYLLMGLPREAIIKRNLGKDLDVKDVRLTEGGCCWLHGVASINKKNPDDGKKAINIALNAHRSMKRVIIVDSDIDIHDDRQVEWAVATRFQEDKDMVTREEKGSSLDPSADENCITMKYGLDATKPFEDEKFERAFLD